MWCPGASTYTILLGAIVDLPYHYRITQIGEGGLNNHGVQDAEIGKLYGLMCVGKGINDEGEPFVDLRLQEIVFPIRTDDHGNIIIGA